MEQVYVPLFRLDLFEADRPGRGHKPSRDAEKASHFALGVASLQKQQSSKWWWCGWFCWALSLKGKSNVDLRKWRRRVLVKLTLSYAMGCSEKSMEDRQHGSSTLSI